MNSSSLTNLMSNFNHTISNISCFMREANIYIRTLKNKKFNYILMYIIKTWERVYIPPFVPSLYSAIMNKVLTAFNYWPPTFIYLRIFLRIQSQISFSLKHYLFLYKILAPLPPQCPFPSHQNRSLSSNQAISAWSNHHSHHRISHLRRIRPHPIERREHLRPIRLHASSSTASLRSRCRSLFRNLQSIGAYAIHRCFTYICDEILSSNIMFDIW